MYKKTFLTINHFFILQRQVIINKQGKERWRRIYDSKQIRIRRK